NYARFCTIIGYCHILGCLIKTFGSNSLQILHNKLVKFILDHSAGIRKLKINYYTNCDFLINHHRFDNCFQNLYELEYNSYDNNELLDKLTNICKNIQSLRTHNKNIYKLEQLIKAQNQIKYL